MRRVHSDANTGPVMGGGWFWLIKVTFLPVYIVITIGGRLIHWILREDERG